MKIPVSIHEGRVIAVISAGRRLAHPLHGQLDAPQEFLRLSFRYDTLGSVQFDNRPDVEKLGYIFGRQRRDEGTPPGHDDDQTLDRQPLERVRDRSPADAEVLSDIIDADPLAWLELPTENVVL
jgi:hypothetical protein